MKLAHEFIKLPFLFDIDQMKKEIDTFIADDWIPHHQGFKGNYSIPLISVNGQSNNLFKGPMKSTSELDKLPYIKQVIASFGEVCGRSRLMMLDGKAEVPLHCDINNYWYSRVRVHIPITTNEDVIFHCGDKQVHMAAGESWIFDSWKNHTVVNSSSKQRVHLVIDFSGSASFWDTVKQSQVPWVNKNSIEDHYLAYTENKTTNIKTENYNVSQVMVPGELSYLIAELLNEVRGVKENDVDTINQFSVVLEQFSHNWRSLWSSYGMNENGWKPYHLCRDHAYQQACKVGSSLVLSNQGKALSMLANCIIEPALNPEII